MRILLVALSTTLAAQGPVFFVDAGGGSGSSFTDIQSAVLAVPEGSTLVVRPGSYAPVLIDGKALTILCDAGVTAGSPLPNARFLTIRNTQPHQVVTVRGLGCATVDGLSITDAHGPVTFDAAGLTIQLGWNQASFRIADSAQVAIMNLTAGGIGGFAGRVDDSEAVFENCSFRGADARPIAATGAWPAVPGLVLHNSRVQLTHTLVVGGNDLQFVDPVYSQVWYGPPAAAVLMYTSTLRVTGLANHALLGGTRQYHPPFGPITALYGPTSVGDTARVDPLVPISGNPPAVGVALTRPALPGLVSQSAPPGGSLVASRHGAPGVLAVMLLSLRGASITVPWLADPIWLDPATWCVADVATTTPSGPWIVQKPVPNQPALRGFQVVWQTVDVAAGGLVPSNPSPCFVL